MGIQAVVAKFHLDEDSKQEEEKEANASAEDRSGYHTQNFTKSAVQNQKTRIQRQNLIQ